MPADAARPAAVTKAPPWHGWVTADLFFNSLSSGTFIVAAAGDLISHQVYGPVSRLGYLIVFPLVVADLIGLIADLGDPLRFHHMLRVFKASSPMSIGVWSTTVFAIFAFICWSLALRDTPGLAIALRIIGAIGIAPALAVSTYKGVLLSATAQPGWQEARWLGATLSISGGAMGVATLLALAATIGLPEPCRGLAAALIAMLALDLLATAIAMREMHAAVRARFTTREVIRVWSEVLGAGQLLPLILIWAAPNPITAVAAAILVLAGAFIFRDHLVAIPQRAAGEPS